MKARLISQFLLPPSDNHHRYPSGTLLNARRAGLRKPSIEPRTSSTASCIPRRVTNCDPASDTGQQDSQHVETLPSRDRRQFRHRYQTGSGVSNKGNRVDENGNSMAVSPLMRLGPLSGLGSPASVTLSPSFRSPSAQRTPGDELPIIGIVASYLA